MTTRRRGVSGMEEDVIQLVTEGGPIEISFSSDSIEDVSEKESIPHVGEENHTRSAAPRAKARRGRLLDPVTQRLRLNGETWDKRGRQATWWVTVAALGVTALLLLAVPLLVNTSLVHEDCRDFEELSFGEEYEEFPYLYKQGDFTMCRRGETVLTGDLGGRHSYISEVKVDLFSYTNNTLLNVTRLHKNCLRIEWVGLSSRLNPLTDCFDLGNDAFWYAAYETNNQSSTLANASIPRTTFVPKDYLSPLETQTHVFGSILHPFWLSSKGVGILVDNGVQLYVSMDRDHRRLCLYALPFELECAPGAANETFFNYTVCVFDTISLTAKHFLDESGRIPHPPHTPNQRVFSDPIWSTASVPSLTDNSLQSVYDSITNNSLNVSLLRIEEGYSVHDGDLLFSSEGITLSKLRELSQWVNLSAWVHPFVNYNTANFSQDVESDFYLPSLSEIEGNSVSLVKWWRGYAAVVNFLSDSVRAEQAKRFENFVKVHNLSSLHFDGGEYTYLPKCVYTQNLTHPADYVRAYVQMVGNSSYSAASSVRVGYFTQDQPVFVRLLDRDFVWDDRNGLQSVLNAVISVGLGGYPFIIPNKIGGNVTASSSGTSTATELYIRWVQLCAFMPVMEFSYFPSSNQAIVEVVRSMTALHSLLVSQKSFQDALLDATTRGYPIVRPLWWLADSPNQLDSRLFTVTDQFLVGDGIMAAPILTPGVTSRRVYFPKGTSWRVERPLIQQNMCNEQSPCADGHTQTFTVPLNETLYFSRVDL